MPHAGLEMCSKAQPLQTPILLELPTSDGQSRDCIPSYGKLSGRALHASALLTCLMMPVPCRL